MARPGDVDKGCHGRERIERAGAAGRACCWEHSSEQAQAKILRKAGAVRFANL